MSDLGDPFEARKNKGPVHPAQDMDTGAYLYARPREKAQERTPGGHTLTHGALADSAPAESTVEVGCNALWVAVKGRGSRSCNPGSW